jgi:hypothetical protein
MDVFKFTLVKYLILKRHYFYCAPNSRNYRLFDLGVAPVAMSFVGASNRDDLRKIRELQAAYGPEWPAHWLSFRNLPDWGELWMKKYREYATHEAMETGNDLNDEGSDMNEVYTV